MNLTSAFANGQLYSATMAYFPGLVKLRNLSGAKKVVRKTQLAIALGLLSAEAGHRVYFTTAIEMTRRLSKALAEAVDIRT